jgi:uncharacterized membrane protein YqjE
VDIHGRTSSSSRSENGEEHSLPSLLDTIESRIRKMVRSKIEVAKIEVAEAAQRAGSTALLLAAGGVLVAFAVGFLLLTAMFALELVLPSWLSALIVGLLLVVVAAVVISSGRERLKAIRSTRQTMQGRETIIDR